VLVKKFREISIPNKWRAAFGGDTESIRWGNVIATGTFGVVKEATSGTHGAVAIKTQSFPLKPNTGLLDKLTRCVPYDCFSRSVELTSYAVRRVVLIRS
jgi:hypothetical protein